jgi:hypothetical protein
MKNFFFLPLIFSLTTLYAENSTYVVRITNKSNKAFTLYCYNFKWRPVLFNKPEELYPLHTDLHPAPSPAQASYAQLLQTKQDYVSHLIWLGKTYKDIAQDPTIIHMNQQMAAQAQPLRPIIKPHSIIDNLPCRLYQISQEPAVQFEGLKSVHTYLEDNALKIEVINTEHQGNCPPKNITIQVRSNNQSASCCIDTHFDLGRVHLIINEDETLQLIPLNQRD